MTAGYDLPAGGLQNRRSGEPQRSGAARGERSAAGAGLCADRQRTWAGLGKAFRCRSRSARRPPAPCRHQGGACGAAGPASAPGLSVGDARPAHAGPHPHGRQIEAAHTSRRLVHLAAVFLAPDGPARGHRVKGGPTCRRFAQTLTRRPLTRIRRLRGRRTGLGGRFCRRCFQVPFEAGPYSLFLVSAHPGDEWTQQLKGALRSDLA
jgi:hypothetical protein